jgi:hypothetical protein
MPMDLRSCGGKFAYDLFPPVAADSKAGMRRLLDEHHLKAEIELGDVSGSDLFCMMRGSRALQQCMTLSVSVLRADSPARRTKSGEKQVNRKSLSTAQHA